MKKLAGYIRVSTAMQAKDGESLETQEEEIKALAEKRDQEFEIYKDKKSSLQRVLLRRWNTRAIRCPMAGRHPHW